MERRKITDIVIYIVIIICVINIVYSLYNIIMWKKDGDDVNNQVEDLVEKAQINEIQGEKIDETNIDKVKDVKIVKNEKKIEKDNPYWAYINMSLINVDFQDLKEVNKDVAGWIQVNGTNINYPYVQTTDNKYYLTHAFDKSYNSAGWVFLDYRNNADLDDKNNIIYAHGRYDKTMFGTLRNALTNGWLNNSNNFVIKIATLKGSSLWQVFSIYHIPTTSDYLQINFAGDDQFLKFTKKLIKRSSYNFNTEVNKNDIILTLSTCYNSEERVVLHAKLIKRK